MINIDEYLRFRLVENKFATCVPRERIYLGVKLLVSTDAITSLYERYDYIFHPLFGTIVLYGNGNIGKTPLCKQIDEEIVKEHLIKMKG